METKKQIDLIQEILRKKELKQSNSKIEFTKEELANIDEYDEDNLGLLDEYL